MSADFAALDHEFYHELQIYEKETGTHKTLALGLNWGAFSSRSTTVDYRSEQKVLTVRSRSVARMNELCHPQTEIATRYNVSAASVSVQPCHT